MGLLTNHFDLGVTIKKLNILFFLLGKFCYISLILYEKLGLAQIRTFQEGPEGVKWELGLAGFCPGKMGFKPLGLGFGHWEWE